MAARGADRGLGLGVRGGAGRLRRAGALVLAFLFVIYALAAGLFWHYQRWIVFMPEKEIEATPADFGFDYRELWLPAGEAARIHGWWVPRPDADAPALLYLQGGGSNISKEAVHVSHLWHMGFAVLIVDYRGSGLSAGQAPSEATIYEDAMAAWEHLRTLQPDPRRRYIYGHSIGAAVAIDLALRATDAAGVIVESSFTSMAELLRTGRALRLLPLDWILDQRFDAVSKIGRLRMPLLAIHGDADEIVSVQLGRRLFDAAPQPKTLLIVPGGGHSNNMLVGKEPCRAALKRFLRETGGRAGRVIGSFESDAAMMSK